MIELLINHEWLSSCFAVTSLLLALACLVVMWRMAAMASSGADFGKLVSIAVLGIGFVFLFALFASAVRNHARTTCSLLGYSDGKYTNGELFCAEPRVEWIEIEEGE